MVTGLETLVKLAEEKQKKEDDEVAGITRSLKDRGLKRVMREYATHSALNAGQATRDIRYMFDHPHAEGVLGSMGKRIPSLANNLFYTAIPPHLHHTQEDLSYLDRASLGDWFRHGYKPWEYPDPLAAENAGLPPEETDPDAT